MLKNIREESEETSCKLSYCRGNTSFADTNRIGGGPGTVCNPKMYVLLCDRPHCEFSFHRIVCTFTVVPIRAFIRCQVYNRPCTYDTSARRISV